jgi:cytoskeletal protein CcmA (bactofilin family)
MEAKRRAIEVPPHPRVAGAAQESGELPGGYTVDRDLCLHGVIRGAATVARGAFLELDGSVEGDLAIEADAVVRILGAVTGDVRNAGDLDVYGVVSGRIVDAGGRTFVHEDAVVGR